MNALERLKLIKRLRELRVEADGLGSGGAAAMRKLKIAKEAREIRQKLGLGAVPAASLSTAEAQAPVGMEALQPAEDALSDDPNSANYRYKDTGYIADSRKEIAANQIKTAREAGQLVRSSSIDWDGIEKNPRAAAELITKSNLFGLVDWDALKGCGIEPGAAFLIDRVYASIATAPAESATSKGERLSSDAMERIRAYEGLGLPSRRKDYATALESIRDRLEKSLTVDDVLNVLAEIRDEINGVQLNAEQADEVAVLRAEYGERQKKAREARAERDAVFQEWSAASNQLSSLKLERDKRTRRGWKPDPALEAQISAQQGLNDQTHAAYMDYKAAHPELESKQRELPDGWTTSENDLEWEARQFGDQIRAIEKAAKAFNLTQNPTTRGWLTFGPKFFALLNYHAYSGGSDAFAGHVTNAKGGKIADWSWAERERATVKAATKQEVAFQLRVVESYQRRGGSPVAVDSTLALKNMLGFRDVQSGNWVLKDANSAKFHVEQTAAAMSDLSDLLGIDAKLLGFGGRLAMAFGARGTGGKNAARAHYEPVQRVINLTKMGGGGCLAHEYLHAADNILGELVSGKPGQKSQFASVHGVADNPKIDAALADVRRAMTEGNVRPSETIAVDEKLRQMAELNVDSRYPSRMAVAIKGAGDAEKAVLAVDAMYQDGYTSKKAEKARKQWRAIAAAYYAPPDALEVKINTGSPTSAFMAGAMDLDGGKGGKYWSATEEMFARAFQSYIEDKLAAADRQNDYLSALADNKHHVDPLFGIEWKPYPEGEERKRLNVAFERFFEVLREERVFERAVANQALMDSVFAPKPRC